MKPPSPLDPADKRPLYRRVESYIESLIHGGGIRPGDPIPSLAQLTRTLGVNGLTVQRAIRELTFRRVLVTLQGRGTFVAEGAVKRVLWVSGQNLFSENASPYQTALYRYATQECEKHRVMLEPVWVETYRPFEFVLASNGGETAILGYLFNACIEEHRLLRHVMEHGRPYVNISTTHRGKPHAVMPDVDGATRLALRHLAGRKVRRIEALVVSEPGETMTAPGGVPVKVTSVLDGLPQGPMLVHFEERGYQWMKTLLEAGLRLEEVGLYVADDVMARGVTRCLLERRHAERERCHLVVRSVPEAILSLGVPVTYLVFDLRGMVEAAVRMLLAQIYGWEAPGSYLGAYELLEPEGRPRRRARKVTAGV